jgi:PAS domain S-box-containing protein
VKPSIEQKIPFEIEYRFRHKSGKICTFRERGRPAVNQGGVVISIDGIILDVTDRRMAEEDLRKSHAHYKQLVENISDVIFTLDLQGIITYISPVIDRLYGYTPGEVTGKHFSRFVHPDDLPYVTEMFNRRIEGECSENIFRVLTRDGDERYVRVTETPLMIDGTITGFNYVMTDITDRKRAEDTIRQSEENFRTVLENIQDLVLVHRKEISFM